MKQICEWTVIIYKLYIIFFIIISYLAEVVTLIFASEKNQYANFSDILEVDT